MRALLLSLSLVLVPVLLAPQAAAYCGRYICCDGAEGIGEPGSPEHAVTSLPGEAFEAGCRVVDEVVLQRIVDCVVLRQC